MKLTIGVDASNIRAGGGLRNLKEFVERKPPDEACKVILWASPQTCEKVEAREWLEKRPITSPYSNAIVQTLWKILKLQKEINRTADILYIPGGVSIGNSLPCVTASQNIQPFDPESIRNEGFGYSRIRLEILKRLMTYSFRRSEGVIFLNEYVRRRLVKELSLQPGRTYVATMGCEDAFYKKPAVQKDISECTSEAPYRLLYVSTLIQYKNQLELLDAIEKMSEKFNIHLTLVGGQVGSYGRAVLDRVKAMSDKNIVRYVAKVELDEIIRFYHEADGFIFASSCENHPNILHEAMSSGLPIMCSNVEPMPTILGECGIYFDPINVDSICAAITEFLENPMLRQRKAQCGYARRDEFSWAEWSSKTYSTIIDVYQSVKAGQL